MAKIQKRYVCQACGSVASRWAGQCADCHEWNTLVEEANTAATPFHSKHNLQTGGRAIQLVGLDAEIKLPDRMATGIAELDRALGGGFVEGSATLIGGDPGIGKSTLLLQAAAKMALAGQSVAYVSGEEAADQVRLRARRLGLGNAPVQLAAATSTRDILTTLQTKPPAMLVIDSIQTMHSDLIEGAPGTVSQVRASAQELIRFAKERGTAVVLVGHVTKDGNLAGPRLLEHMVDTVISLEGDRQQLFRLLRVLKNRFGPNQEMLIFQMLAQGLELVEDPSTYFLGARDASLSGTAVVMAVDGQRPLAVEIQALVTKSYLAIPRRTGLGFDVNRLHLLLAVLEKRLNLSFAQVDIYAKVGGGMRLMEPGMDLPLVAAVLSSYYDVPLPERAVFWGEVDLNGQIRPVAGHVIREGQARRLGYHPVVCPVTGEDDKGFRTLKQVQQMLFARRPAQGKEKDKA